MTKGTDLVIKVERRKELGKEAVGRLRRSGRVPAVVYGGGMEPISISVDTQQIQELLKQEGGENTIFLLKLKGTRQERRAIIKDLQVDPVTGGFVHIDFVRVTRGQKLTVTMPVELVGDSVGVRHGGRIDFVSRELQLEVLPREMFEKIEVDISELDVGEHIKVKELEPLLPKSAKLLEDPNRTVVVVEIPRITTVEEAEAEAEAEAELVISEQAEPEVIHGKGREAEEAEASE